MSESYAEESQNRGGPTPFNQSNNLEKRSNKLPIIIVLVVVISCLCIGICTVAGGRGTITGLMKVNQERDNVAAVIEEFMQAMMVRDTEAAYALFSTRAQRQTPLSDVEEMLAGNNYVLFENYQSTLVTNLSIKAAFNTNDNLPQGTVAEAQGTISYDDGFTGTVMAVLEEENDEWRLHNIHITVPPNKFGNP